MSLRETAERATVRTQRLRDSAASRARRLPWARLALRSFEREQRSGAGLLAGGLAYRFFFWLVSFGLIVAAVARVWVRSSEGSLTDAAKSFGLSGVAARSAAHAVESGSNARWYLLATGFVLVLYFGLGAVRALRVTAFVAWQIKPTRVRKPVRASATFTGIFVVGLGLTTFTSWVRHHDGAVGLVVTAGTLVGYAALALVVFDLLPKADGASWRSLVPGAVLAAIGFTAIHLFTVYYLSDKLERSPKLYGTLGAATVVLLGLYLIARVIVSAMFLNATVSGTAGSPDPGDDLARRALEADWRTRG
ncbi:MAG: YhjD/YihY/BrkB family envelope integrity protein [Thermoleophilaceae bacterium]